MFQRVTIIGNLGGDPEMRTLDSGTNVTSFSVATNRRWTNNDGSQGEETVWWRVSAWGRLAEITHQYLSKGRQVFIEGTMSPDRENGGPRIWTDQNGNPRASYELRAETVQFLGGRDDSSGYSGPPAQEYNAPQRQAAQPATQRRSTQQRSAPPDFDDSFGADEIPF
ncbi:MAG: single-stranded DNA-binding protein [Anaerolineales bacterium]|nr:single-stranded DNA-binding protein [Anaerolineales bacterium]MCB9128364.1 single-stranded DNA-binding protein [Ardenticatenales bacterium]MCB9172176.1 single-stranded DNA-binding protein [Ardenticatenales bacterium]